MINSQMEYEALGKGCSQVKDHLIYNKVKRVQISSNLSRIQMTQLETERQY